MTRIQAIRFATGLLVVGSALLMADGKAQTARITQSGTVSGTTPPSLRIPVGISFTVRLRRALNSGNVTAGTGWDGVLVNDLVSPQGRVYALAGTTVSGVVASVHPIIDSLPGSISLRAMSIDGVELYTGSEIKNGPENNQGGGNLQPNGRVNLHNSHAGTTGSSGGFATSATPGQVNLAVGAILTFDTTVP